VADEHAGSPPLAARVAAWRRQSVVVAPAGRRVDADALERYLDSLGVDGERARRLDWDVGTRMLAVTSLSSLTSPLALDYLDRVARPVPALTPARGVDIVARSYVGHLVVESEPAAYGAPDVPVLGTLPPLRRGYPPRDLLTRVVKASRRGFESICAVSAPVWDGFVQGLVKRAHDTAFDEEDLIAVGVVDGLARFGWVLRQVDIHYGLEPDGA
jgi:hypothetical protein